MGVVLLKSDGSLEATKVEAQEKVGENGEFDKYPERIRLQPISFISRSKVSPLEKSRYSFLREAATVRWDTGEFRQYLWGEEFTLLSDCNVLKTFFELEDNVPHMVHRWRSELLQYQFVICHHPERMM